MAGRNRAGRARQRGGNNRNNNNNAAQGPGGNAEDPLNVDEPEAAAAAAAAANNAPAAAAAADNNNNAVAPLNNIRNNNNDNNNDAPAAAAAAGALGALPPPAAGNNNNVEDDEDEDDEEDDDVIEVVEEVRGENDGTIEGGVAGQAPEAGGGGGDGGKESRTNSRACDLYVLFENTEKLQREPTNLCGTVGTVISVGLENKNTKMSAVFKHYCKFVSKSNDPVCMEDLEFTHNDVLGNSDTAEGCAVMKGDKICVRLQRKKERKETDSKRLVQQESDKEYLKQLRGLFLESVNASSSEEHGFPAHAGGPNLVLECRPYLEVGQRGVLNHFIKAHEGIVSKRCPWLKEKIVQARQDLEAARMRRETAAREMDEGQKNRDGSSRVVTIPDVLERDASASAARPNDASASSSRPLDSTSNNDGDGGNRNDGGRAESNDVARDRKQPEQDEDMDDDDAVMHVDNGEEDEQGERAAGAQFHQIDDNDDDDGETDDAAEKKSSGSDNDDGNNSVDILNENRMDGQSDMLWVPLKSHPPEAVKLLLEYCYTNRVISLGKEAFTQAATKTTVPPYQSSMKWPNHGQPTVSMAVTLAGIALAEEARMPRLSLMCEVAASNLVNDANVLDALASCTAQVQTTGNRLTMLRKKAMNHLLYVPLLKELGETKKWLNQLEEHKELVVPALLQGTEEMVALVNLHVHNHHHSNHGNHHHGGHGHGGSGSKRKKPHVAAEDRDKERLLFFETLDRKDRERRRSERANRRVERKRGEHHLSMRKKVDFSGPKVFTWR